MLDGRVAIVTAGAGPGMGSQFSRSLAGEGAAVVVADIDGAQARAVAEEIQASGGRALGVATDVANASDVQRMVDRTVEAFGTVSILANHAGIIPHGAIDEITEEQWDRSMGVHLKGAFLCSRAVTPHMKAKRWGRIVNTASRAAYRPMKQSPRGVSDYAAAKGGVIGFSRALALEVGPFGITVNVIAPGLVSGRSMAAALTDVGADEERIWSEAEGQVLPPRFVRPDEVAAALLYLVGPHSDRTTGAILHINGGSYFPA